MNKKIRQQLENYVKKVMGNQVAHDFKHADRVRNWALQIAKKEGFKDLEIVEISALLHDIGLPRTNKRIMHGEVGAKMAVKFLKENNSLPQEKIEEVYNAIRYHNKNREGEGILLNILRDADILDLFGAVGILRGIVHASSRPEYDPKKPKGETWNMGARDFNKRFDSGVGKGKFIIDTINFHISCYDNLSTKTAKLLAKPLVKFTRNFIKQFDAEIHNGRNGACS
ncbi:MAG: HD domain-containing protein [Patescibacteria group bacterium]|nr:HD domain-containing protein [Patescibacteria group bacterium]